jgi:hypothetical protein
MKLTVEETEMLERAVATHCRVIDQLLDARTALGGVDARKAALDLARRCPECRRGLQELQKQGPARRK